ncbi:MAG: hypothetical protein HYZ89_02155 [Candidatus Omnitrophica bacterium]|nr:hypothetical protein [Candidatus Omnitrophota bacterium]
MVIGLSSIGWLTRWDPALWAAEHTAPTGSYQAKDARDPFIPLVREGRVVTIPGGSGGLMNASSMILSGILWDPSHQSIALINDEEVKVGDTIGGYQVTAIRQDAVVLVRDGKSLVLQLAVDDQGTLQPPRSGGGKSHRTEPGGERW